MICKSGQQAQWGYCLSHTGHANEKHLPRHHFFDEPLCVCVMCNLQEEAVVLAASDYGRKV